MGFSAFVDDGYTDDKHVDELPGLYPAVDFTFRPMTREGAAAFYQKTKNCDSKTMAAQAAEELASRIVKWDILNQKGDPVEVSVSNVLKLRYAFATRLENIVFGSDPGDMAKRDADLKN